MERTDDTYGSTINAERKCDMTNGDKIRTMTDEEMAEKVSGMAHCMYCPIKCGIFCTEEECKAKWLDWLRSPVEESEK